MKWKVSNVHDVETETGEVLIVGNARNAEAIVKAHNEAIDKAKAPPTDTEPTTTVATTT